MCFYVGVNPTTSTQLKTKTLSEYVQKGFFLFLGFKKMHQNCTRNRNEPEK